MTEKLSRDEFIRAAWELREQIQEYVGKISEITRELKRARPDLLSARNELNWDKLEKLGRYLKAGYWEYLYQLAWKFVSKDSFAMRQILAEFLTVKI